MRFVPLPRMFSMAWLAGLAVVGPGLVEAEGPEEVTGLVWCSGSRECLEWSPVAEADDYRLYRGEQAGLPCVAHAALDSCLEGTFATTSTGAIVTELPTDGRLFWFLVTAVGAGVEGSAGNTSVVRRVLDTAGSCTLSCAEGGAGCGGDGECCSVSCDGGLCDPRCSGCPAGAVCGAACTYVPAVILGYLDPHAPPGPDEVSGVAQSRVDPQVLWMHNDDTGAASVYAFTSTGTPLGTYFVQGTGFIDPEDIAAGPGPVPGERYLYLGDVGGNQSNTPRIWGCTEQWSSDPEFGCGDCPPGQNCQQREIRVVRAIEPPVSASQEPAGRLIPRDEWESIMFGFPSSMEGELQNVETLMLDPLTLDLYFVTKSTAPPRVFRAPYPYSGTVVLEQVATLDDVGEVTGGDISADGHYVAIRTETEAWVWERPLGTDLRDVFSSATCGPPVPITNEPKGEALGLDLDNSGSFYTVSEADGLTQVPIHYFERE